MPWVKTMAALGPFEGRYQGVEGSGLGGGVGEQPATLLEGGQVAAGRDRHRAVVAAGEAGDGGEEGTGWLRRKIDRGDQLSVCRRQGAGEFVVLGAFDARQLDAAHRDDEGGDDAVADGALVTDPVAGPAEVRIEPRKMGVVGAGVGGGETEASGERSAEGDAVGVGAVAVALVGDEQPAGAARPQVGVAGRVDDSDDDVVVAEVVAVTVAEAADLRGGRHVAGEDTGPLLGELAGRHQHEDLPAAAQFGDRGGHADDRLAGAGDRFDHAPTAMPAPRGERFELPLVQLESRRGVPETGAAPAPGRRRWTTSGPARRRRPGTGADDGAPRVARRRR